MKTIGLVCIAVGFVSILQGCYYAGKSAGIKVGYDYGKSEGMAALFGRKFGE